MRPFNRRNFFEITALTAGLRAAGAGSFAAGGMRLGVIIPVGKDAEAAVRKAKDFGFPTCQVSVEAYSPAMAGALRKALDRQ